MARPVTLFTGQWADLPLEELAAKCGEWGFDGLELACWGDHFDVDAALADDGYVRAKRELLERHGLECWAIGTHLVGQACATRSTRATGRAARGRLGRRRPRGSAPARRREDEGHRARRGQAGCGRGHGFTGSPVWHMLYSFPPNDWDEVQRGYEEFAERWNPIIDVFDEEGVKFALEVHPTEIAYDFPTTEKTLEAIGRREGFGINFDPSHFAHQFLDSGAFIEQFADRIYHVHVKDSIKRLTGAARSWARTSTSASPSAAGPSCRRVTATSTSRTCSACSTGSATTGRSRSSGRTRGWTATGARPTRWRSSAAPTSRPRRWPSTPRSRGRA